MSVARIFARLRSGSGKSRPAPAAPAAIDENKVTIVGTDQETLRCLSAGRRERYQRVVFTARLVAEGPLSVGVQSVEGVWLGELPDEAADRHHAFLLDLSRFGHPCCLAELKGGTSNGFEIVVDLGSLHVPSDSSSR